MTLTQKNLRPQDAEADNNAVKEITTVEILMDDTAIPHRSMPVTTYLQNIAVLILSWPEMK